MKTYSRPIATRRQAQSSYFLAWTMALLALAPLSVMLWAVQTTGMGIA